MTALDLFCGAGGASAGISSAGFEVVGIDNQPQPHYPFEFRIGNALEADLDDFDFIWASPPCQAYSMAAQGQRNRGKVYPDLLPDIRKRLERTRTPWVIENVPGAPMRPDYKLCGCQFDLKLRRERWFETSWNGFSLFSSCHHPFPVVSVVGHGTPSWVRQQLGFNPNIWDYREAMGIGWMNRNELSQAIPPAYSKFIALEAIKFARLT